MSQLRCGIFDVFMSDINDISKKIGLKAIQRVGATAEKQKVPAR